MVSSLISYAVSELHGIQHAPKDIELELQDLQRPFLLLTGTEMLQRYLEAVLHVAPRLGEAAAEVRIARGVDPRIVLRPAREALLVDLGREELRERGAHRLLPGGAAREVDVRVDREAHCGQHVLQRRDLLACKAYRLAQAQPGLDAAVAALDAVVVDDALDPAPALLPVGHVGEDRRVLDRNADLVVEAVQHPSLHLLSGAAAAVHGDVEGMVDVVAVSLRPQLLLELWFRPRIQSSISIPS